MKIKELKKVPKKRVGRIVTKGIHLELHEYETLLHLALYGFDIEVLESHNIPYSNNPDIVMSGTSWEMKSLETSNKKTIKKRVHKASLQADHVIFDLRRGKSSFAKDVERDIVKRFTANSNIRRMIIIEYDGTVLDIVK